MLFNTLAYLILVSVNFLSIRLVTSPAIIFLLSGVVFYLFAGLFDFLIFLVSLCVNWQLSIKIKEKSKRITLALIFNVGLLVFFKYSDVVFAASVHSNPSGQYLDIILPLGISFYTFQVLAYHIDASSNTGPEAKTFSHFALFIGFFPQLIAGPIVRSRNLLPQLERLFDGRPKKVKMFSFGLSMFLLGLFKKVVIADSLAPFVDGVFGYGPESFVWAWIGSALFAFQIYYDFSGYSDMALGSAYLLGIKLPINFRTPYLSKGPQEFWRRWHITLSVWIRDYLYLPLGGGRSGTRLRNLFVLLLVMSIAGLWHGAGLTFLIWGALWGVYIFLARCLSNIKIPTALSVLSHFLITTSLWVMFRANDFDSAHKFYSVMFGFEKGHKSLGTFYEETQLMPALVITLFGLCLLHIIEDRARSIRSLWVIKKYDNPFVRAFLVTVIFILLLMPVNSANPFIYFRF